MAVAEAVKTKRFVLLFELKHHEVSKLSVTEPLTLIQHNSQIKYDVSEAKLEEPRVCHCCFIKRM